MEEPIRHVLVIFKRLKSVAHVATFIGTKTVKMTVKIENIFMELKFCFKKMGIFPRDSSPSEKRFTIATYCIIFAVFITMILSIVLFLLLSKKESQNYFSEAIYMLLGTSFDMVWYFNFFWYSKSYILLFQEFNTIVGKSE